MAYLASSEKALVEQIARYLQVRYPGVIYRFDLAADLKLTQGQAARHKRLHPTRGYPDLLIAHRVNYHGYVASGLFLELKKEGCRLKKRDGSWASEHIEEQARALDALASQGYVAQFSVGYDETVQLIDSYLGAA